MNNTSVISSIFRFKNHLSHEEIHAWLMSLRGKPFVPESEYDVGTVMRVQLNGQIFYAAGVNVENPEHLLSTHGEMGAMASMLTALGKGARILEVWVMGAPRGQTAETAVLKSFGSCCGRCRQQLFELSDSRDVKVHYVSLSGDLETQTVGELLPHGFNFDYFLPKIREIREKSYARPVPGESVIMNRLLRRDSLDKQAIYDWLTDLEPIDFASYEKQTAIIILDNGMAVGGVRIEDSAFTGVNAVQSAIANAIAMYGHIFITQVHMMTWGRKIPAQAIIPPSLSVYQVLRNFGASRMSLSLYNAAEEVYHTNITAMASYAPTSARPYYIMREGQLTNI
jgi:cytidine deaminase